MLPSDDRSRPAANETAPKLSNGDKEKIPSGADLAMRCALLRVRAERAHRLDPSGWLSAQLLDLADLLESAEREGWFGR